MAGTRTGGVTLVAVLAWISGALSVLGGVLVLIGSGGVEGATVEGVGTPAAWISIIIGVMTIAVGVGLLRGSNIARIIAAIVFILNLASALYTLFAHGWGNWSAIFAGILALIGLLLLFTPRANEFFRS